MIFDFFEPFGAAGTLLCIAMIFPPMAYCFWLKKKWKVLTLRPPRRYFFFGTILGICLAAILLIGFEIDGTLISPSDSSGNFHRSMVTVAKDRTHSTEDLQQFASKLAGEI